MAVGDRGWQFPKGSISCKNDKILGRLGESVYKYTIKWN